MTMKTKTARPPAHLIEKYWQELEDRQLAGLATAVLSSRRLYRIDRSLITSKKLRPDLQKVAHLSECGDAIEGEACMAPDWQKRLRKKKWARQSVNNDVAREMRPPKLFPVGPIIETTETLDGDLAAAKARLREWVDHACETENAGALNVLALLIAAQLDGSHQAVLSVTVDYSLVIGGRVAKLKSELDTEQQDGADWWKEFARDMETEVPFQIDLPVDPKKDDEDDD